MVDDQVYDLDEPFAYQFDTASLSLLLDYAVQQGLSEAFCLADTGLDPVMLDDPEAGVLPEQELKVISNLVDSLGQPFWHGFNLGLRYDLSVYGIWGLGLMTSANTTEAIKRGWQYWGATPGLIRSRLEMTASPPTIFLDYSHLPDGAREFLVGRLLGTMYAIHRDLIPERRIGINGVWLTLPRRKGMERVEALYGCYVSTNEPEACLTLDPTIMGQAFQKANAVIANQCDRYCEQIMAERKRGAPVLEQVQQYLKERAFPPPSLKEVAQALNMSERSLRRHLETDGTSWRQLLVDVLIFHAEQRLRSPHLSIQQVADELGYADPSGFSHAFKRWTGESPAEFRKRL